MNTMAYLFLAVLAAVGFYLVIRRAIRVFSRVQGARTVTCPESGKPVSVRVDASHATLTSTLGRPDIRLEDCSRWPMKGNCGQECLLSLDVAPEDCLVSGVLMRWYNGKICVYCRKVFEDLNWTDHRPALRTPEGELKEWREVKPDDVLSVLQTHYPVCWDCYIAQSFRREHPDLVVYRPWRNGHPGDMDGSSVSRQP